MTTVTSIGQYFLERHFGRGALRNAPLSMYERLRRGWVRNVSSVWRRGGVQA
jgi:hypothetical protein